MTSCEPGKTEADAPLAQRKCIPCEGGIPKLEPDAIARFLPQLNADWRVVEGHHLRREYKFPDFALALDFVNRVGALAEDNGHHPDLYLTWGRAAVELYTHAVNGLTETDFILAAKIDEL